jgi:UMF1 family MFS transporter
LVSVWQQVRRIPSIVRFLAAFFFYSAGVQTVIFLAATFAEKELQFDTAKLIATILLLQIVGIGGAYLFAVVARKWGNKSSLLIMLSIWILICVIGYIVSTDLQFYAVAAMVGLVMGGIQAISRSTYAKLLRDDIEEHTSFFSFYDVLEKLAIILGTFLFGFIDLWLGGMRNSILALGTLFLIGILILRFTDLSTPHKT